MESNLPLWIIEDCTWPVMWGLFTVAVLGFIWFLSQRLFFLLAAIVVAGLIVATVLLEMKVVTDKEYVVNAVYQMADAVRNNDPEGIVRFVDVENQVFQNRVRQEMGQYDFRGCQVNGFSLVEVDEADAEPRIARVAFSVWASGTLRGRLETFESAMVAVELEFVKKRGRWFVQAYGYRPANSLREVVLTRN